MSETIDMSIENKLQTLFNDGVRKVIITYKDGKKEILRLFRSSDGSICHFYKNSRRRGYYIMYSQVVDVKPVIEKKSIQDKWEDGWKKVKARLEKSGLWADIIKDIDLALEIGYDTLKKAYDIYWSQHNQRNEIFKAQFPKLMKVNAEGEEHINTTVLWYLSKLPKVKKMRFSKDYNDSELEGIQKALNEKREYRTSGRVQYDVSFSYNPEAQKAWYSEEFKNCGNGHYYLALDATHAIFWEDD